MLSVELARDLKEAGIAWEPARGDWVYLEGAARSVVVHDAAAVCGVLALETDEGAFTLGSAADVTWLPTLDQLLRALGHSGEFVALDWSEGVWRCYGNASGVALAQGATAEEACARALLEALRGQGQVAGLAASPGAPGSSALRQIACQIALVALRIGPAQRASLDWAVTVLLTLFALGFALTAAALAVWLGLRLLGVPVVLPAAT